MQKNWGILIGILVLAFIISTVIIGNNKPSQNEMPNPASTYCTENEGRLEIITQKDGSQYGICTFEDNSSCEEWAFYRGECTKGLKTTCTKDEECVPDSCCHAKSCAIRNSAPSCQGVVCSQECEPGTLDCGQGSCRCVNGLCEVLINE